MAVATIGRRGLIGALAVAMAMPAAARRPAPPREGLIWWAGPGGRHIHGRMAIPAPALGRQPAVLILGDGMAPDPVVLQAVETVAATGLIACTPDFAASGPTTPDWLRANTLATIRWLATNAYATGYVGAIGFGSGAARLAALAAAGNSGLAALALFPRPGWQPPRAITVPLDIATPSAAGTPARSAALADAIAFLKLRLR